MKEPLTLTGRHRLIYNCDGDNTFIHDEPPMSPGTVYRYADEVARCGVTTFFMSCHVGMDFNFPGTTCQLAGSHATPAEEERIKAGTKGTAAFSVLNFRSLVERGHDPLGLMLERSRERGMETFVTFRLNEVHCVEQPESFLLSRFWLEHPEWHVGKPGDPLPQLHTDILGPVHPVVASWIPGGLNFAVPEVRAHVLAQLTEICGRYDVDGLDLDFQRFPIYFRFGEEPRNAHLMTEFVRQIRTMTREVGAGRCRPLLLSARIMARPEQNLGLGLDPIGWAREGLLDFVTVSHYLRNTYPLPIAEYRAVLPPDMPLYASIEYETDPERYRSIARQLWRDGVDGIMVFNFFAAREGGREPPWDVLSEIRK